MSLNTLKNRTKSYIKERNIDVFQEKKNIPVQFIVQI